MSIRRTAQTLRLRGPLADDPTAKILHALLVGLIGFQFLDLLVELPLTPRLPASVVIVVYMSVVTGSPGRPSSQDKAEGNLRLYGTPSRRKLHIQKIQADASGRTNCLTWDAGSGDATGRIA